MLLVERIVNNPVDSNCFVVFRPGLTNAIVIDPGSKDGDALIDFLRNNCLRPDYIVLTHEHFDHVWGVNRLKDEYHAKIICSWKCAEAITNPKRNFSVFYDQVGFATYPADIILAEFPTTIQWNKSVVTFSYTPGHSEACICINVDDMLFTGDTLMKREKTLTKLVGGNKEKLKDSLDSLCSLYAPTVTVYPGHGDDFKLSEIDVKNAY